MNSFFWKRLVIFIVENDLFFNQENNTASLRKPQYLQPEGTNLRLFTNEFAGGLDFLRQFFDDTCKNDAYKFIETKQDRNPELSDIFLLVKGYELLIFELENKKSFINLSCPSMTMLHRCSIDDRFFCARAVFNYD